MSSLLVLAGGVAVASALLAGICGYGRARDAVVSRRLARRPVRVAELTPGGWAEVVPGVNPRGYPLSMN